MANRKTNGGSSSTTTQPATGQQNTGRSAEKNQSTTRSRSADKNTSAAKEQPSTKSRVNGQKPGEEAKLTVTFNVTVPEAVYRRKQSVWLTGTVNQLNSKLKDWDPRAQQMKKVDNTHWTVTWSGPAGTVIEYKYTLGDWEHVELDQNCNEAPNRRVTIHGTGSEPLNIVDTVPNFRGLEP
jgi:hypothetical protein